MDEIEFNEQRRRSLRLRSRFWRSGQFMCVLLATTLLLLLSNDWFRPRYDTKDIFKELDFSFRSTPSPHMKIVEPNTILYNFFLDLEPGFDLVAGSYIHLYADRKNWAIVFENCLYNKNSLSANIELRYIGNCIDFVRRTVGKYTYVSNVDIIPIIDDSSFEKVRNRTGVELELFELIDDSANFIKIRDALVSIEKDPLEYKKRNIEFREFENPNNLVSFDQLLRLLADRKEVLTRATEEELSSRLPYGLEKILTIDEFHYASVFEPVVPQDQELFQLIAKVLVKRDASEWNPSLPANSHWSDWESGTLN